MPSSDPSPLARLGRAIDVYLAQESSSTGAVKDRVLEQNSDLRDLLEPLLDSTAGVGEGALAVAGRELGDFRIVREVGRGGMGVVFEASQKSLDRLVALKVLEAHVTRHPAAVARFKREAMTVARLRHPGIVEVYAVGSEGDTHFFAMELIEGVSLQEILSPEGASSDADVVRLVDIGAQVCDALGYAHANGVVHRDVKPSNILVRHNGEALLTDFGLALEEKLPSLTATGGFAGTPHYVSPEQASSGRHPVDHRTDIFSLGASLYEMLTGKHAFPGQSVPEILTSIVVRDPVDPRRLNSRISRDLSAVLLKALEKEPARRYQSALQMGRDLRAVLNDEPVTARPPSAFDRVRRSVQREPLRAALLLVLAFSIPSIALLGGYLLASRPQIRAGAEHEKQEQLERALAEADLALMDGNSREARRHIGEALATEPSSPEACQAQVALLFLDGNGADAVPWIRARVREGLDARAGRWLELFALAELGNVQEAEHLRAELPQAATATEFYLHGCIELARARRLDLPEAYGSAARLFRRAVTTTPFPRRMYLARWAFAVADTADRTAQEDCLASLMAHVPDSPLRSYWIGLATTRLDPMRSLEAYRAVLAGGRDLPSVRLAIGNALDALGRKEESIRELKAGLAADKDRRMRPEVRGYAALRAGDYPLAREEYERALVGRRESGFIHNNLGNVFEKLGDPASAEREYRKALEIRPDYPIALFNLAALFIGRGKPEQAREPLERYLRLSPGEPGGLTNLAWVNLAGGDPEAALRLYEQVLAKAPEDPIAVVQGARCLAMLGRVSEAITRLRAAVAKNERLIGAWEVLADLLLREAVEPSVLDPVAAAEAAQRAVDLASGPAKAGPLTLLARARLAAEQFAEAGQALQQGLKVLADDTTPTAAARRDEITRLLRRYRTRLPEEERK